MADSQASTVVETEPPTSPRPVPDKGILNLSSLPPIFVSATHLVQEDLHELEDAIAEYDGNLTYDLREAKIVLSKVVKKARIEFDVRSNGVWTKEVEYENSDNVFPDGIKAPATVMTSGKRKRLSATGEDLNSAIVLDDESTASAEEVSEPGSSRDHQNIVSARVLAPTSLSISENTIKVVKLSWFHDSKRAGKVLPLADYLSYQGRLIAPPAEDEGTGSIEFVKNMKTVASSKSRSATELSFNRSIIERAKEDTQKTTPRRDRFGKRKFGYNNVASRSDASRVAGHAPNSQYTHLLHTTTSEYDFGATSDIPDPPEWVKAGIKYACQRRTPAFSRNERFIDLLKKIRTARELTADEIGVRAYSTSIAAIAAYPYKILHPKEILQLPGCDTKIANLFVEFANSDGHIKVADELEADEELKVMRIFYDIWGVGATTAREFYFERGWRDLDDIVEYGWSTLTRVQQIGVKYYDEFLDLIPRSEVEEIGKIIHYHAVRVRNKELQSLLVGGYRRGKEASGDVDIVLSHPDESQTLNLVNDVIASLEEEEWVTHTLLLSLKGTHRDQQTLPFRSGTGHGGHGFDTLDKALVVWQNPEWATKSEDMKTSEDEGTKLKNPNIHRRVDIIVAPWRAVGCAVAGWSGGTTFQRDLRRFAKKVKGWKFDSSGVRDRRNGEVVDLEGWAKQRATVGRAKTMEEAERRAFEGMGLAFIEPCDRCTG